MVQPARAVGHRPAARPAVGRRRQHPRAPITARFSLAAARHDPGSATPFDDQRGHRVPRLLIGFVLLRIPAPVVALNRAVALSQAQGPAAALPLVQALMAPPQLAQHHLLPGVLADLLARLGRHDEARAHWLRAVVLTHNARERALRLERTHHTLPEGGRA